MDLKLVNSINRGLNFPTQAITNHRSQTHHRSQIHQPINNHSTDQTHHPKNPSAPIKNQTLHHPPPNPATTKQTHHNTGQQPPRKTHKKTTTDLAVVDLETHQPWQQSQHTNRQRRGRWRENREERG